MTLFQQVATYLALLGTIAFFIVFIRGSERGVRGSRGLRPPRLDETSRALLRGTQVAFAVGLTALLVLTIMEVAGQ